VGAIRGEHNETRDSRQAGKGSEEGRRVLHQLAVEVGMGSVVLVPGSVWLLHVLADGHEALCRRRYVRKEADGPPGDKGRSQRSELLAAKASVVHSQDVRLDLLG
jgi:hypothetical protein